MPKKERKFADDGWAVWIDGDDTSTVYINDWLNPKGNSYVDLSVRVCGVKSSKRLCVYVPFEISKEEIDDVSLLYNDMKILQAIFSATCIVDYMKNEHTSEIAYNGKTVDVVHISTVEYGVDPLCEGTLISIDLESLQPFIDNDEAYFSWRMPHKTIDAIFHKPRVNIGNVLSRLRDLITTPVVAEKYGYSIRINELRLLPERIARSGSLHRQKLKKAVVTISIDDGYDLNDANCYRIRRLEEDLYRGYAPDDYSREDVITYQWQQNRDYNLLGQFNFYYILAKESVNGASMFLYMVVLMALAVAGEILGDFAKTLLGLQ